MKLIRLLAAAGALAGAVPASAADFAFTFSSGYGSGSGVFTTSGPASTTPTLITALTGTLNGAAMSLLAPGAYPGGAPNDNLFIASAPWFSFNGLSFAAGGSNYNFYSQAGAVRLCGVTSGCEITALGNFTVSEVTSAVPEPATWAMMLLGFGLVGLALRSRKKLLTTYA